MIPIIPTLIFSIVSFAFSAFTILHAVAPLIPESRIHPRKRNRAKNGLPQPEKAHIWLSVIDIFSVILFVWQVFEENRSQHSDGRITKNLSPAVRLHVVVTLRQTCLFVIMVVTLIQIRQAKASSFGLIHLLFWLPSLVLAAVSSVVSGIVAGVGAKNVLYVTGACMCALAVLNTMVIAFLIKTLEAIRCNLLAFRETQDSWQDIVREGKAFPRDDIEALKERSSWITSISGSVCRSISSFSFGSTVETRRQTPENIAEHSGNNSCSQNEMSWLTEPSVLPSTMTDWSFPTTESDNELRNATALSPIPQSEQFLTIVRSTRPDPTGDELVKVFSPPALALPASVNVSWRRIAGWMAFVWIPSVLAAPFVFLSTASQPISILLTLSVTIAAPVLSFNAVFGPLPIPTDLFGDLSRLPQPSEPTSRHRFGASVTLVEGRRSGDVWLSKGDAIDGKGKLSRAISYLSRTPRLAVLPVKSDHGDQPMKREATHHMPQYDSAATSAFVAINAYCANELGWLPDTGGRDVYSGSQNIHGRRASVPKSYSTLSRCGGPSSSSSRRSSATSRSSSASRPHKNNFMTNLETIPDVSMGSPVRHTNSAHPAGGNMYLFPRAEPSSPVELFVEDSFLSTIIPPIHARDTSVIYEQGPQVDHQNTTGDDSSISESLEVPFPSRLVRTTSDRSTTVPRFGSQ